jgi:prepilin-type processing-associated H-X9-DG protein
MLLETRNVFPDLGSWLVQHKASDGGGSLGFWHDHGANWGKVDGHVEWATVPGSGAPECWWHDARAPTYNGYGSPTPVSYGSHSHPNWIAEVNVLYLKP